MNKPSTSKTTSAAAGKKTTTAKTAAENNIVSKAVEPNKDVVKESAKANHETTTASVKTTTPAPVKVQEKTDLTRTSTKCTELSITLTDELIARCAYFLWEKDGYQHGKDREYWLRAEEQLKRQVVTAGN